MAGKLTGLGSNFYIGGYDLSGDVNALGTISTPVATLDVTAINKYAMERRATLADGQMSFTTVYDTDAGAEHLALSGMPRTDTIGAFFAGTALGNAAASINAKEVDSQTTRANDAMLTRETSIQANGYGLEWGVQLTAGLRTDTGATSGTGVAMTADGVNYLALPGSSGNYASTPDAASLDIVGDIDLRVQVAMTDWTPASGMCLISKYNTTGNQRSYNLTVLTSGLLQVQWSEDGTVQKSATSSVAPGYTDGTAHWVRVTLDVDNGASNSDIKFWTSEDNSTWTQLGTTQHSGAVTSIFSGSADLELGASSAGASANAACKIFQAQVYNGIAGSLVANPLAGTSSITDSTGKTWTVNGASSYVSALTAYGLQAYLQVNAFTGTDATVKLQESADNGVLDSWTDVVGGAFTAITTAPGAQRIQTSRTQMVEKYLRAVTTTSGGFSNLKFAVMYVRNKVAVNF